MTYDETLNYIHSLGKFRYSAGLERINKVCQLLGNPQNDIKCIHIAGTNGKGSVAKFCAEILKTAGYKTGLFISPFVVDFKERIQINNEYISENDLIELSETVKETKVELNEFEFITAVSLLYFRKEKVDFAVMETGLGGRLDATNVLSNVLCSTITKIGLDHTAILGDTIREITAEKCGIIKKNRPVVTVCNQERDALSFISGYTDNLIIPEFPKILNSDLEGNRFLYRGEIFETSLIGVHQAYNAVTAIETIKASQIDVDENTIKIAIKNAVFPGRLEIVKQNPTIILDGAHNPDGANALTEFLKKQGDLTIILAMMKDKNYEEYLKIILKYAKRCIVTEIDNNRCMKAEDLSSVAGKYSQNTECIKDLDEAIEKSKEYGDTVLITGSLYLVSAARKIFKK